MYRGVAQASHEIYDDYTPSSSLYSSWSAVPQTSYSVVDDTPQYQPHHQDPNHQQHATNTSAEQVEAAARRDCIKCVLGRRCETHLDMSSWVEGVDFVQYGGERFYRLDCLDAANRALHPDSSSIAPSHPDNTGPVPDPDYNKTVVHPETSTVSSSQDQYDPDVAGGYCVERAIVNGSYVKTVHKGATIKKCYMMHLKANGKSVFDWVTDDSTL